MYHVLLCCLLTNSPYVPSPVNHAVRLFSAGLQDADLKVECVCLGGEGRAAARGGGCFLREWKTKYKKYLQCNVVRREAARGSDNQKLWAETED